MQERAAESRLMYRKVANRFKRGLVRAGLCIEWISTMHEGHGEHLNVLNVQGRLRSIENPPLCSISLPLES
ncbi:hypothetical protein CYJ37_25220 [Bacillus sp. UMB0728]|nr:hypothetical protein CYJ37_25220 [Bacillus sp. UMB0728]